MPPIIGAHAIAPHLLPIFPGIFLIADDDVPGPARLPFLSENRDRFVFGGDFPVPHALIEALKGLMDAAAQISLDGLLLAPDSVDVAVGITARTVFINV